jgi:holo-[acyl-carrier protein] synthase
MIDGIGIDIFEVRRIKAEMERDDGFVNGIFTEGEIAYCENMSHKEQYYAARYSAKEAFLKALGTGWRFGIRFADIDIFHDNLGKPNIRVTGKAEELVKEKEITKIHVSMSHIKEMVTAIVILEK